VKTRFTFNPAWHGVPVWSPDGSQIIYTSEERGHADLYRKWANGTESEESLLESDSVKFANDCSLDGRFLLYEEQTTSPYSDIWVLPLFGSRKPFPLVQSPFSDYGSSFSPDGRWVVYTSDESGSLEVYVVPFRVPGQAGATAVPAGKWQISTAGGQVPIWRRDGKEILYQDLEGCIMSAEVSIEGGQFHAGKVRPLSKLPPNTGFDATPDGQRFLIKPLGEEYSAPITLLVNWKAKLNH
jgi:Tol biopolymer transport system component